MHSRVLASDRFRKEGVNLLRRIAFVAADVDRERRMVADAPYILLRDFLEEAWIIRIGTVPRVGQPEILPDHDAVAVTGLVELLVTGHSDPVADDGEIHVGMVGDRYIVFASAIVEEHFGESPIAAEADEAAAVDVQAEPFRLA